MKTKELIPDFLIIGAHKSGTGSLHNYLNQHPDIFMSYIKEPGFFLDSEDRKLRKKTSSIELLKWMLKGYDGQKLFGESTTHYTKAPIIGSEAPKNIKLANPNMKFIYVIRNPLDRIISHFLHGIAKGYVWNKDFNTFLKKDKEHVNISLYFYQLSRYLKYFNKEQIKIIVFEEFIKDPQKSLDDILKFLKLGSFKFCGFEAYNRSENRKEFSAEDLKFKKENYDKMISKIKSDVVKMEKFLGGSLDIWDLSEEGWCK